MNQPTSEESAGNETGNETCANCGMAKEEWQGNGGQGFKAGNNMYCCQGCATGTGCTC